LEQEYAALTADFLLLKIVTPRLKPATESTMIVMVNVTTTLNAAAALRTRVQRNAAPRELTRAALSAHGIPAYRRPKPAMELTMTVMLYATKTSNAVRARLKAAECRVVQLAKKDACPHAHGVHAG